MASEFFHGVLGGVWGFGVVVTMPKIGGEGKKEEVEAVATWVGWEGGFFDEGGEGVEEV